MIRLRALVCVALLAVSFSMAALTQSAYADNPHGSYSSSTKACQSCHDLHAAPSQPVLKGSSEKVLCYSCHDGTGSAYNTKAGFGESTLGTTTAKSFHPVPTGVLKCADCHTPHEGPAQGNLSSLKTGSAEATSGIAVCDSCHGAASELAGGNVAVPIVGTPHESLQASSSPAQIACLACHAAHASANESLVTSRVVSINGESATVTSTVGLCVGCHRLSSGTYSGVQTAMGTQHAKVTTSTKASVTYPGTNESNCTGCHEPHGTGSGTSYTRKEGAALCEECHDASGVSYPAAYSYRGGSAYAGTPHASSTGASSWEIMHSDSQGFSAWESTFAPTPSSRGTTLGADANTALWAMDANYARTAVATLTGESDYQLYRFKLPGDATDLTALKATWVGYGEAVSGFPVTLSIWNASSGTWVPYRSQVMAARTTVTTSPVSPATYVDADGFVWLRAEAKKVVLADVATGPSITLSGTVVTVSWTTYGPSSGWFDFGTSSGSYTQSAGSDTLTTSHVATFTAPADGAYYYRLRSTDQNGVTRSTAEARFGVPAPVLQDVPDYSSSGAISQTFNWSMSDAARAPYTYQFTLKGTDGFSYTSAWQSATTIMQTLATLNKDRLWTWSVTAKDASGVLTPVVSDTFTVTYTPPGTCPYLFTWNGTKFSFESDLYGQGKLAVKIAAGYLKPDPNEYYLLREPPAEKAGALELRLVEERTEVNYLDQMDLYTVDAPSDRDVVTEMPLMGGGAYGGLDSVVHTLAKTLATPKTVHVNDGKDVTNLVSASDGTFLELNEDRNAGLTYQTLELDLGNVQAAPGVKLYIDGRTKFPDSEAGLALVRSLGGRTKLEVQDSDGAWVEVPSAVCPMPKSAEFYRPYVMDLTNVWQSASRKVRLTFLFNTFIDRIGVDTTADEPVTMTKLPLVSADLRLRGFDATSAVEEFYEYTYGEATGRKQYFTGTYTKFGNVSPLLTATDDRFVIYGGGDEIALSYATPAAPVAAGRTRSYLVYANGYYKDHKSDVPKTVEPLPFSAMSTYPYPAAESYPNDVEHAQYRAEWNTRQEYAPYEMPAGWDGYATVAAETSAAGAKPTAAAAVDAREPSLLDTIVEFAKSLFSARAADSSGWLTMHADGASDIVHRSLNTDLVMIEALYGNASNSGSCGQCHAVHGAVDGNGVEVPSLLPAEEASTCGASGTGNCHSSTAASAGGVNVSAAFSGSNNLMRHDVFQSQQTSSGSKIVCTSCHNPHKESVTDRYSDPDSVATTLTPAISKYFDPSGSVYVLVGAEHDGAAPVVSNQQIDYTTPTVPAFTWTTDENATTWLDWGLTTSYEIGSYGSNTLAMSHRVSGPTIPTNTQYHYRVRSTDALGNEFVSADATYTALPSPLPPATISPMAGTTTITNGPTNVPIAVSWAAGTPGDADALQYQVFVDGVAASGWVSGLSTTANVYSGSAGTHVHSWYVRARDAVHTYIVSGPSVSGTLSITDNSDYSCPILYTWDGQKFGFVTDVMGRGVLGIMVAPGEYRYPPSIEDSRIDSEQLVAKDGKYLLRLKNEKDEIEYVDNVTLRAIDHPKGSQVYLDDVTRTFNTRGMGDARVYTVKDPKPVKATYDNIVYYRGKPVTGMDITKQLAKADGTFAPASLFDDNRYTFDLGDLKSDANVKLVMRGWSEFATPAERTEWLKSGSKWPGMVLEVSDGRGGWKTIDTDLAFIPGYDKTVVFDLSKKFPAGSDFKVRMRGLTRTHIDWVGVDTSAPVKTTVTELAPTVADLSYVGQARAEKTAYPSYDYNDVHTPGHFHQGAFTKFGDVRKLLGSADDRYVIMDTGDEVALSFDEQPVPAGMERTYVIHTDGYFQELTGKVDPLPFHAMTNYPYGEGESYPTDALHKDYLTTWNTRVHGQAAGIANGARLIADAARGVVSPAVGKPGIAIAGTTRVVAEPGTHFSANTDKLVLRSLGLGGTLTTMTASSGYESASASLPTPGAPGSSVSGATLASASTSDGAYWRTNLTSVDRSWNWQVLKFTQSAAERAAVSELRVSFAGYGEPTAGYTTKIAIWNAVSGSWEGTATKVAMGTQGMLEWSKAAVPNAQCLACHDGSAPAGVTMPAGVTNVAASWGASGTPSYHGAYKTSGGFGGGLVAGYTRGVAPDIACATCHDPHGSASVYHFPLTVRDRTGISVTTGTQSESLCSACHTGGADTYHASCLGCHRSEGHGPWTFGGSDCVSCHRHSGTWDHQANDPTYFEQNGCHCGVPGPYQTF
ncbi:MAG: cytochrome c3 family protein [Actinomycetia bacterium]|nr:cytochrome c3 family protein [Actinomycetes bacterium]